MPSVRPDRSLFVAIREGGAARFSSECPPAGGLGFRPGERGVRAQRTHGAAYCNSSSITPHEMPHRAPSPQPKGADVYENGVRDEATSVHRSLSDHCVSQPATTRPVAVPVASSTAVRPGRGTTHSPDTTRPSCFDFNICDLRGSDSSVRGVCAGAALFSPLALLRVLRAGADVQLRWFYSYWFCFWWPLCVLAPGPLVHSSGVVWSRLVLRCAAGAPQPPHESNVNRYSSRPDSAVRVRTVNDLLQWIMGFSSPTRMGWIFVMARARIGGHLELEIGRAHV